MITNRIEQEYMNITNTDNSTDKQAFINEARYTEKEVERILGLTRVTLWRLRRDGLLGYYKLGGKLLFGQTHINAFLAKSNRAINH
jgi:hypothetical protein